MDSIGSIIKAVTPPPAGTPEFGRGDDRFDALLATFHDDLTELRDEAAARARDRAQGVAEGRARGQEVREDAQRLRDLDREDRVAIARVLGRKGAEESGADEPRTESIPEPEAAADQPKATVEGEPAAVDQPKATIEGEPAAAPADTDDASATAPAAATATGEVTETLQAPAVETATLAATETASSQTFDSPIAANIASIVGEDETSGDIIGAAFVLAAASLAPPVDDLIATSQAPLQAPTAALTPAAAVATEIAVPTEGVTRDAATVLVTLLPAAVSGQPARPKLAAAPLPLALGDEIPALPLTASATALANTSASGKGIAQLFERIAARLNTSSAGPGAATALPVNLGAEIATSLTGNGLPSAVAAAVREWLGDTLGGPRPAGEPLAFGSILNASTDAAAGVAQAKAATLSHQAQLGRSAALQVAVQITKAAQEGVSHISIRLHPAELGRVDVKLEVGHDGRVIATISAERSETLDLLQRDSRDIERLLQNAGLNADAGSLSFGLRGGETEERAGTTTTGGPAEGEDDAEDASAAAQIALGDGSGQHALNILV